MKKSDHLLAVETRRAAESAFYDRQFSGVIAFPAIILGRIIAYEAPRVIDKIENSFVQARQIGHTVLSRLQES